MAISHIIRSLSRVFKKRHKANQKGINHQIATKNKWLYPTDSFGKLERGVEY